MAVAGSSGVTGVAVLTEVVEAAAALRVASSSVAARPKADVTGSSLGGRPFFFSRRASKPIIAARPPRAPPAAARRSMLGFRDRDIVSWSISSSRIDCSEARWLGTTASLWLRGPETGINGDEGGMTEAASLLSRTLGCTLSANDLERTCGSVATSLAYGSTI